MASADSYAWSRSDGTTGKAWRARWIGPDGKPKSKRGFARERQALAWAGDRESEARHGIKLGETLPTGKTTVAKWSQLWLAGLTVRPQTAAAYGYALQRINSTLGSRALSSLRPSELKAWRKGLHERYADSTADLTAAVLAMLLRAAVMDGLLPASPMPRKDGKDGARLIDPAELLTMQQVLAWGEAMPHVAREMPLVAASTGLRQGELLGLRVEHVDFLRRSLQVVGQLVAPVGAGVPQYGPTKTRAGVRTVPLSTATVEALSRHLAAYPPVAGEPIFRNSRGGRWRRGTFGECWQKAKREAELPGWAHWHGLRDVFASSLIYARQDSHLITTLMGHSSAVELAPYARLWPSAQDAARTALDSLWAGTSDGHGLATRLTPRA